MAGWRKGYLYQWTGNDWVELDPKEHGDKYMVALADLLEHAPDGVFNNLFCMNLIAQEAFVRYLQALEITLSELTENGKTKRGAIKSQNYRAGLAGFKIDYDGNVEFNDGLFRGRIEAGDGFFDDGVFNNMKITGELEANVSMLGGGTAPIVGAVREYVEFEYKNGNIQINKKSDGIEDIERLSTGVYKLIPSYARYFTWDPVEINITGNAYETITIGNILNPPSVRCTGGLTVKNHSIEPELIGSGTINWYINRNNVGFYNPSGQLRDPAIAMVLLIA